MGYVVSVGNGMYLKKGTGSKVTSDKTLAYQWNTLVKATNVSYAFSKQFPEARVENVESMSDLLVVKATDKQIVDIEHEAEFNKYNVCDGYKCYKKLHDIRVKRREAKDELEQIGYLSGINVISPNSVIQAMKCIDGMDGRKYRPRYEEEDGNAE